MEELTLPFFMVNLEYFNDYLNEDDFAVIAKFLQDEVTAYESEDGKQFTFKTNEEYNKVFREMMNCRNDSLTDEEYDHTSALISKIQELDMANCKPIVDDINQLIENNWYYLDEEVKDCLLKSIFQMHQQVIYPYAKDAYVEMSYIDFIREFEDEEIIRWKRPDKIALAKALLVDGGYEVVLDIIKGETVVETIKVTKCEYRLLTKLLKYFDANWCKELDLSKAPIDTVTNYVVRTRVDDNGKFNIEDLDNYVAEYELRKNNDPN